MGEQHLDHQKTPRWQQLKPDSDQVFNHKESLRQFEKKLFLTNDTF